MVLTHKKIKELLAVYYALKLCSVFGCSVLIYLGITTTLAYAQKFGGATSPKLLEVSEKLWSYCIMSNTRSQMAYTNSSNRIVPVNRNTQEIGKAIWIVHCESVRNNAKSKEDITEENNNDNNNSDVEVGNLVSDSINDYSRSKKRKIFTLQKQILVADGMENQRRTLQKKGLIVIALDLIKSNTILVKRISRYYATQKIFMDWRHGLEISGDIT
ncbi:hypothetical protein BB561_004365, partial [Smittium simulii]